MVKPFNVTAKSLYSYTPNLFLVLILGMPA